MQSVSAGLIAASAAAGQRPVAYVEVDWAGGASLGAARAGAGWTDETAYLISHRGSLNLNAPGNDLVPPGEVGQLSLTLDNKTQRFSWLRTDGPLYANIGGAGGPVGKRVRLWQGYLVSGVAEYVRIFTGVITSWTENNVAGTVEFRVQDMGWEYAQQQRQSSVIEVDHLASEWIAELATLMGVAGGDQVLDAGIFRIPYVWLDDEALISELWDTATADGGRAYFDQLGKLHFENVVHWAMTPHNAVQWAFGEDDYTLLDPAYSTDDLATKIIVEYLPRAIGVETVLYTMRQLRTIAPGVTDEWDVRFTYPAFEVIDPQSSGEPIDYRIASSGGYDLGSDVTLTLQNSYAGKTGVKVVSTAATLAASLVFLQVRGYPLLGGPIEQVEVDVSPAPVLFDRDRSVRGNPYLQTWAQANALANFLAGKCKQIRPTWTLRNVPGVPQLEPGDRVSFVDRRTLGAAVTREGYIVGIQWEGSGAVGFKQDITVMDSAGMYDYSDWYIIGTTPLGNVGRCWY